MPDTILGSAADENASRMKAVSGWLRRLFSGHRISVESATPIVEEYEPRLLYSADAAQGLALPSAPTVVEQRYLEASGEYAVTTQLSEQGVELLIVDSSVSGFESLLESLNVAGRTIELVVLEPGSDGIAQISAALSGRENIAAVHIVSHGESGELRLGNTVLDSAVLSARATEIGAWGDTLAQDGDILLYGCDTAAGTEGQAFIRELSLLTGADVAGSLNQTGSETLGADWRLEFATGTIEAEIPFDAGVAQWEGVLANAAPVLSGANDLAPVSEDAASNSGTLVSDLIAGQVTDADPGALSGIAVVAVDDTNGTWQYSTDGGSTWNSFGTVSTTSARLLGADGNTYVRFVPDANFNGTVTNGLTFHAWDQTSGTAGGTADTTALTTDTVRDNFGAVSYSNNNGTESWTTDWVDVDGNANGGNIFISGGQLVLSANLINFDTIDRGVDLSGATSATLSFSYNNQLALLSSISLQISSNGGSSYSTIATFSPTSNTGAGTFSSDISAFISANTRIRFAITGVLLGNTLSVDNIEVAYTTSSFSAASASSDITVTAVNDAPVNTVPGAQTVAEDSTLVFSSGNANQLSIADVDAASGIAQVTLSVTNGTLSLSGVGGLTFSTGDGSADSTMVFTGTLTDVNAALNGLTFTPTANFTGAALLTLTTSDQGNTGAGGALNDSDSVSISVTAVNDAPVNTVPGAQTVAEDSTLVFSSGNANQLSIADVDAASGIAQVTLSVTNGALSLSGVGGLIFSTGDGSADATMVFTGTLADVNAALNGLTFTPIANFSGVALLTLTTDDQGNTGTGGALNDSDSVSISVTAVNDAPVNTVPGAQGTNQDTPLVFSTANGNALAVSDADAGLSTLEVTLTATNGTVTLSGLGGLTFSTGDGSADATMVFTGTLPAINAALNGLQFDPTAGFTGAANLQIVANDQGNTGAGGAQTDTDSISILVNNTNDGPINAVPGGQSVNEDTPLVFSAANGNGIAIADPDAGSNAVSVTLDISNGTLSLASIAGLIFSVGDGGADATMVFTGTLADVNAALNGLTFTPTANFSGAALLTLTTNDQGNTGTGGALNDTDTVNITVQAIADTPGVTNAATNEDTQTTSGLVITPNAADGATVTHFKITGISGGTLFLSDGVTVIADGSFITVAQGAAGLKFTPAADSAADGSFRVQASVSGTDAGLGGSLVTATIDVTAVNDAPSFTLGGNQTVNEDAAAQSVAGFASAAPGGGADEAAQSFTYTVTNDNNALFLVQPTIDASGQLSYTLAPNAAGIANVSVFVTDSGGTANGGVDTSASQNFTITVTAVNDAPVAAADSNTLSEDAASVAGSALANDTDTDLDTLTVAQVNGAPGNVGAAVTGLYGSLTLNANGSYGYALDNALAAVQALRPGDTLLDTFTYQASDGNGGTSASTLTVTITGLNDVAVIGGVATGNIIEDSAAPNLAAAGALTVSDADAGESALAAQAGTAGAFGTFTVDAAGNWSYSAANSQAAVQQLATGATLSDTFNVVSADGSTSRNVVIVLTGVNDAPNITGTATAVVNEDASSPQLSANGVLAITDADAGQSSFIPQAGTPGAVGSFSIDAAGNWNYAAFNSQAAIQQLPAGATLTESFNVTSSDGTTTQTIVVTVSGVNDAPLASDNAVTLSGTTAHTLQASEFGYADVEGQAFATLRITGTPASGALLLDGIPVVTGQEIPIADLAAGRLSFALPAMPSDVLTEAFTFQVNDGTSYSASNYTFTVSVIPNLASDAGTVPFGGVTTTDPPTTAAPGDLPSTSPQSPLAVPSAATPGATVQQDANGATLEAALLANAELTNASGSGSQQGAPTAASDPGAADSTQARSATARHGVFFLRTALFDPLRFDAGALPVSLQSAASDTASTSGAAQNATFLRDLDRLRETLKSESELEQRVIGSAVAVGAGLSVGYVIWLLRGGLLITSLLSSLPAWRFVDPLPVLGRLQDDEEEDDESLESMVVTSGNPREEEESHG
jgi:VCBS repeat-containing protein